MLPEDLHEEVVRGTRVDRALLERTSAWFARFRAGERPAQWRSVGFHRGTADTPGEWAVYLDDGLGTATATGDDAGIVFALPLWVGDRIRGLRATTRSFDKTIAPRVQLVRATAPAVGSETLESFLCPGDVGVAAGGLGPLTRTMDLTAPRPAGSLAGQEPINAPRGGYVVEVGQLYRIRVTVALATYARICGLWILVDHPPE